MDYLRKVWQGEEKLWITYWLFGFAGNIAFQIYDKILDYNGYYDTPTKAASYLVAGVFFLWACYNIFVLVSIWRSAGNYTGSIWWRRLAQFAVFGGVLNLVSTIQTIFAIVIANA